MIANNTGWRGWLIVLILALGVFTGCPQSTPTQTADTEVSAANIEDDTVQQGDEEAVADDSGREMLNTKYDYPVEFTASFVSASYPGKAGVLSDLGFKFVVDQDYEQIDEEKLEVTSDTPNAAIEFNLPANQVRFTPLADPLIELSKNQYGSYGGYRVEISDSILKPMAVFEVDKTGKISKAASNSGYGIKLLLTAPNEQLYCYAVMPQDKDVAEPLLAIDLHPAEFEPQEANDLSGGTYSYRFPGLKVTLYGPELVDELQLERGADQQAFTTNIANGMFFVR